MALNPPGPLRSIIQSHRPCADDVSEVWELSKIVPRPKSRCCASRVIAKAPSTSHWKKTILKLHLFNMYMCEHPSLCAVVCVCGGQRTTFTSRVSEKSKSPQRNPVPSELPQQPDPHDFSTGDVLGKAVSAAWPSFLFCPGRTGTHRLAQSMCCCL